MPPLGQNDDGRPTSAEDFSTRRANWLATQVITPTVVVFVVSFVMCLLATGASITKSDSPVACAAIYVMTRGDVFLLIALLAASVDHELEYLMRQGIFNVPSVRVYRIWCVPVMLLCFGFYLAIRMFGFCKPGLDSQDPYYLAIAVASAVSAAILIRLSVHLNKTLLNCL